MMNNLRPLAMYGKVSTTTKRLGLPGRLKSVLDLDIGDTVEILIAEDDAGKTNVVLRKMEK